MAYPSDEKVIQQLRWWSYVVFKMPFNPDPLSEWHALLFQLWFIDYFTLDSCTVADVSAGL